MAEENYPISVSFLLIFKLFTKVAICGVFLETAKVTLRWIFHFVLLQSAPVLPNKSAKDHRSYVTLRIAITCL